MKHPIKPEWGVGQVLEDQRDDRLRVYFGRLGDAKTINLQYADLSRVEGEEADDPLLRNVTFPGDTIGRLTHTPLSLPQVMDKFLADYPGGFRGERYQTEERSYKDAAVTLMAEQLGGSTLCPLLAVGEYVEVAARARRLIAKTNLVFPNEAMALNDGLKDGGNQRLFAKALAGLLCEGEAERSRFERFADCLETLGAAKWTIASYFQFLRWPESRIFIKPMITKNVAALWRKEISYRSELNWTTYAAVQEFAHDLREAIRSDLSPRDMIDVQSFMWCVANRM